MKFDLHSHSVYSHDGVLPPEELLAMAEAEGLSYFSITDHNSAKAHLLLQQPALRASFGGRLLSGTELSATFRKVNIELLGYGFEPAAMQREIERHWVSNEEKFRFYGKAMIDACRRAGATLNPDGVERFLKLKLPARKELLKLLREYPENRRLFLFEKSWEDVGSFLRQETNNPQSPLFVDLSPVQVLPETAAKAIRQCGGMVFIAHPLIYSAEAAGHLEELIERVCPDGLECFYPAFFPKQTEQLLALCEKHRLFASGGSDHHGPSRPNPLAEFGSFQGRAAAEVRRWIDRLPSY